MPSAPLDPVRAAAWHRWNFSDVNPPTHAWATFFVYEVEKAQTGTGAAPSWRTPTAS